MSTLKYKATDRYEMGWTDPRAMGAQVQIIKDEEKSYAKNRNPRP